MSEDVADKIKNLEREIYELEKDYDPEDDLDSNIFLMIEYKKYLLAKLQEEDKSN